jgi:hypothetical protein
MLFSNDPQPKPTPEFAALAATLGMLCHGTFLELHTEPGQSRATLAQIIASVSGEMVKAKQEIANAIPSMQAGLADMIATTYQSDFLFGVNLDDIQAPLGEPTKEWITSVLTKNMHTDNDSITGLDERTRYVCRKIAADAAQLFLNDIRTHTDPERIMNSAGAASLFAISAGVTYARVCKKEQSRGS